MRDHILYSMALQTITLGVVRYASQHVGSQVAFTTVDLTHMLPCKTIWSGTHPRTLHFATHHASDGIQIFITVCEAMVFLANVSQHIIQPSNGNDKPLMQIVSHRLQYSNVDSALWTKVYGSSRSCKEEGSYPMLWLHCTVQYMLISAYNPLLSADSTHMWLS